MTTTPIPGQPWTGPGVDDLTTLIGTIDAEALVAEGTDTGAMHKSANLSDVANVATARTNLGVDQTSLDNAYRDTFNIRDARFGAVLNGTTDDTAAVQAAIDAAFNAGGGTVLISGPAKVTTLVWKPGVVLQGTSPAVRGTPAVPTAGLFGTSGSDVLTFNYSGAYSEGYRAEKLYISGGRRGIACVNQGITNLVLSEVNISGQSAANMYFDTWLERCLLDRVQLTGAPYGFQLVDNGTTNNYMDKCTFRKVRAGGTISAFRLESYRACNSNSFEDLVLNGSNQSAFTVAAQMASLTFINPVTEANGSAGPTKATTTGSITASSSTLTVASATNLVNGQQLTIAGAGTSGSDLVATISSISGTTVTLSGPATVSVSGAEVTNMIYDEFVFAPASSGGQSSHVTFIDASIGSSLSTDRIRYAVNCSGGYVNFVNGGWTRPVNDPDWKSGYFGDTLGPIRQKTVMSQVGFAYRNLVVGQGQASVYPGTPGKGTVLSLRGDAGNEDSGNYGYLDVVRTDPNRTRVFRLDPSDGSIVTSGGSVSLVGSAVWLKQNAISQAFLLTGSETYDSTYGTLASSNVAWPDGTSGVYTTTSMDSNGAVTGFTVTWVGSTTKTVTAAIPRDANGRVSGTMTASVS